MFGHDNIKWTFRAIGSNAEPISDWSSQTLGAASKARAWFSAMRPLVDGEELDPQAFVGMRLRARLDRKPNLLLRIADVLSVADRPTASTNGEPTTDKL